MSLPIPDSSQQWRGQVAADQQRLRDGLSHLDNSIDSQQTANPEQIVAAARREADEIRAAATHVAREILQDARSEANLLDYERKMAVKDELDRRASLSQEIETTVDAAISALGKARELLATDDDVEAQAAGASRPNASVERPAEPTPNVPVSVQAPAWLERLKDPQRLVLGAWGGVMLVIVLMLTGLPTSRSSPDAPLTAVQGIQLDVSEPQASSPVSAVVATAAADEISVATPTRQGAPQAAELVITLRALRECWVSTAADGGSARERLLQPAETVIVRADEELVLRVGNAAALSLKINDQPAAPLGAEGQVVTRRISLSNYRSLLLGAQDTSSLSRAGVGTASRPSAAFE